MANCSRKAGRMTLRPDLHGRAGWRCDLHGGRLPCNVPGCGRTSVGRVAREDDCGLAGHRCYQHGARRCEVPLCKRRACGPAGSEGLRCARHRASKCCTMPGCRRQILGRALADHLGPAGFRCGRHGGGCNVAGCARAHWGTVQGPDSLGPAGRRCFKHGGKTCSISGCLCKPARHVRELDGFGPPGIRCQKHCPKKSGPRNRREGAAGKSLPMPGTCNRADGKGWRCKRPVAPGSRECEYHYMAHVQKQRSKRRAVCATSLAKRPRGFAESQTSLP